MANPFSVERLIDSTDTEGIDCSVIVQRSHVYGFDNKICKPEQSASSLLTRLPTDANGEIWSVRDTAIPPAARAEVTVSGPASELLCFVWNRRPLTMSTIERDRRLIDDWSELVQL